MNKICLTVRALMRHTYINTYIRQAEYQKQLFLYSRKLRTCKSIKTLRLIFFALCHTIYLYVYPSIPSICLPMAVQPYVGAWPLCQFLNPIHGRIPWIGDQLTASSLPTHRINVHRHALRGIRTHDPRILVSENSVCLAPCGHSDWHHI